MKIIVKLANSLLMVLLIHISVCFGQNTIRYTIASDASTLEFSGEASVSDFHVTAESIEGFVQLFYNPAEQKKITVDSAATGQVTIPVRSLKGGNALFNRDMYNTLNAEEFPEIKYTLTKLHAAETDTLSGAKRVYSATGELTIAGNANELTFPVIANMESKNSISFQGETEINMSDWGIEPPKKLFGTLRVQDEISLNFTIILNAPQS